MCDNEVMFEEEFIVVGPDGVVVDQLTYSAAVTEARRLDRQPGHDEGDHIVVPAVRVVTTQ